MASRASAALVPSSSAVAEADADVQQLVQLVNRFVISSVQFLNRFAAECEAKLVRTDAALQQLEVQTQLLEHMLLSSGAAYGEEEEEEEGSAQASAQDEESDGAATSPSRSGGMNTDSFGDSEGATNYANSVDGARRGRSAGQRRRRRRRSHERGSPTASAVPRLTAPPAAPTAYRKGPARPPPGVARAAAAALEEAAARTATLAIVGASVPLPPPSSSGDPPAPPPPLELRPGRFSMRTHPRLKGYFELLALRVPRDFVKAKMAADGYHGEWLDTPDAPAPPTLTTVVREFADEPD